MPAARGCDGTGSVLAVPGPGGMAGGGAGALYPGGRAAGYSQRWRDSSRAALRGDARAVPWLCGEGFLLAVTRLKGRGPMSLLSWKCSVLFRVLGKRPKRTTVPR